VVFCEGDTLTSKDLRLEYPSDGVLFSTDQFLTLSELERRYIEKALQIEHGRVEEVARKLGLSRSALYEKIRKHGINLSRIHKKSPEFRTEPSD
jgi:DNA-binding NtrC family response regulator